MMLLSFSKCCFPRKSELATQRMLFPTCHLYRGHFSCIFCFKKVHRLSCCSQDRVPVPKVLPTPWTELGKAEGTCVWYNEEAGGVCVVMTWNWLVTAAFPSLSSSFPALHLPCLPLAACSHDSSCFTTASMFLIGEKEKSKLPIGSRGC